MRKVLKEVPSYLTVLFCLAVVLMNLLANKSISLPVDWLALDCGIVVSWVAFLTMDIITKKFGPKDSTMLSIFALLINLIASAFFFIISIIPGEWSNGSNEALDATFGGSLFVLLGSSVAFLVSSLVNNSINWIIGKDKKDTFGNYVLRSYVSTFIAQLTDNFVFAIIVSYTFFGWSILQCFMCSLTGAVVELVCEIIFSPLGWKISKEI